MKQKPILTTILFLFLINTSCQKEEIQTLTFQDLQALTIRPEGCFNPHCMTLIIGHLDEKNLFNEIDNYEHPIEWYKNDELYCSGTHRLDCTGSGIYIAKVFSRKSNLIKVLMYVLNLEPE